MKDATELKGLGNLRTAVTTHLRSKPAREGTEYLDLYLASNEKKRLAKLVQTWEKQKSRAQERQATACESIARLERKVGMARTPGTDSLSEPSAGDGQAPASDSTRRRWKKMPLDY